MRQLLLLDIRECAIPLAVDPNRSMFRLTREIDWQFIVRRDRQ